MTDYNLFDSESPSPSSEWDEESSKHALDELFKATFAHRNSGEFYKVMEFITKFYFYSPYNAFLIYTQRPGATYVATPSRWIKDYGRRVKPNANPLVILRPMGPVMFVFDVSDTAALKGSKTLPDEVVNPFRVRKGVVTNQLDLTIENSKRDGIKVYYQKTGSQAAGSIQRFGKNTVSDQLNFQIGRDKKGDPIIKSIPISYAICLKEDSENKFRTENYATLVHELAHLYCGHLGTPNKKWWSDRHSLSIELKEFEAESVSYLVCKRIGIETKSDEYLSNYVKVETNLSKLISFECIMKASGLIEQMGSIRLKLRKD